MSFICFWDPLFSAFFFALGLRPLRKIAGDVAAIESGARESLAGPYPRELEPLTRNLDRLLKTEKANQARYRSALDSLAHSLKTPLAVIRAGLSKNTGPESAGMETGVVCRRDRYGSRSRGSTPSI